MRRSMRWISGDSPRSKNMPSLVRAALTSLPPVVLSTVSERARRGRASSTRASHSAVGEQAAEDHHARQLHRQQHAHRMPFDVDHADAVAERRLGHADAGGQQRRRQLAAGLDILQGLQRGTPRTSRCCASTSSMSSARQPAASLAAHPLAQVVGDVLGMGACAHGSTGSACGGTPDAPGSTPPRRKHSPRRRSRAGLRVDRCAAAIGEARHQAARTLGEEADDLPATRPPFFEHAVDHPRLQRPAVDSAEVLLRRQVDQHPRSLPALPAVQVLGQRGRPSRRRGPWHPAWRAGCPSPAGRAASGRADAAHRTGPTGSPGAPAPSPARRASGAWRPGRRRHRRRRPAPPACCCAR